MLSLFLASIMLTTFESDSLQTSTDNVVRKEVSLISSGDISYGIQTLEFKTAADATVHRYYGDNIIGLLLYQPEVPESELGEVETQEGFSYNKDYQHSGIPVKVSLYYYYDLTFGNLYYAISSDIISDYIDICVNQYTMLISLEPVNYVSEVITTPTINRDHVRLRNENNPAFAGFT
jgi:hypothetical protein